MYTNGLTWKPLLASSVPNILLACYVMHPLHVVYLDGVQSSVYFTQVIKDCFPTYYALHVHVLLYMLNMFLVISFQQLSCYDV